MSLIKCHAQSHAKCLGSSLCKDVLVSIFANTLEKYNLQVISVSPIHDLSVITLAMQTFPNKLNKNMLV